LHAMGGEEAYLSILRDLVEGLTFNKNTVAP
jgi:hypothetical protein